MIKRVFDATTLLQYNLFNHLKVICVWCELTILNMVAVHGLADIWNQYSLQWRHNGRDGVSNHQPHHCLLNLLFRRRSKKTSKFRVTGLCPGNSPGTGEFPAQMASNAENVSIWWRHHVRWLFICKYQPHYICKRHPRAFVNEHFYRYTNEL